MDLPDCPPGAEGYQDSVVEIPKKPDMDGQTCTKAEQEFQEHLNSLKIKLDNDEARCMVERRGRDISGKWIYLCYPCGSVCSGESILQTHISGKKHKTKLAMRNTWPVSIFDDHPFNQNQKGGNSAGSSATEKVLQKMAAEVEIHKADASDMDQKLNKYRKATCHIQDVLDALKAPLVGLEYLVEHPPEKPHYEPLYVCTLCTKQGHPRTIVNHLTCFWHRYNFLLRHFPKACSRFSQYKNVPKYREGFGVTMHRLCQRVEDKFGRLKPINIDKEEYEKEKEQILQWIFKGFHFTEKSGITLEEVVDADLIESLAKTNEIKKHVPPTVKKKDPSPPVVAAPSKPHYNARQGRKERHVSIDSLSDISDDTDTNRAAPVKGYLDSSDKYGENSGEELFIEEHRREIENFRSRFQVIDPPNVKKEDRPVRPPNFQYKVKLAQEKAAAAAESAAAMLAYHEKNPEKHVLYPEEWKKFWNRRYKEIQAEGKDASKHDFKPEWIVFWTKRMKEIHQQELQLQVTEIYRRMNILPPDPSKKEEPLKSEKRYASERRNSPEPKKMSLEPRKRSPNWTPKKRSPEHRGHDGSYRSSDRRRSPDSRHRSPSRWLDYRYEKKTSDSRYKSDHGRQGHHSSPKRTRSRSPPPRRRSAARAHISLESARRSRSPLSRRDSQLRNRSPLSRRNSQLRNRSPLSRRDTELRNRSPAARRDDAHHLAPSMQTVMISDDELKPDDGLSPWNSDNEISSIGSAPAPRRAARARPGALEAGPPENVVATLRVLVALEDYLGSLGPKIVDLLTEALIMEKERANSSEELLERESALVLMETVKEKLKGAAQAGLVPSAAAPALRAAVVRAAATLHEADKRARKRQANKKPTSCRTEAMPVAGVGQVDRAQIAHQMAAALVAQGKTDVTSEELAQLVDAVVGMAEAKKREAEATKKFEGKPVSGTHALLAKMSGTATALQMLQSAYDENDKKIEKEDAPDAMDGLSDSDLETLLKNFNELSAEEQHSLIAYLKKLEAREPQRVERLRQYVSAAATTTTPSTEEPLAKENKSKTVTIESDDDDYTVEEVFKSATQKVKEDQIRKELDIVTKSLEESKEEEAPPPPIKAVPIVDLSKHLSSASDLFALVQASIKSTAGVTPAATTQTIDVVTSNTLPRSFGDILETPLESLEKPQNSPVVPKSASPNLPLNTQDDSKQQSQNQSTFNSNYQNEPYDEQANWNQKQVNDIPDNRGPPVRDQGNNNFSPGGSLQFRDLGQNQFEQGSSNLAPNQFGQVSNSGTNQLGQPPNSGTNQFGQISNSGPNKLAQVPSSGQNKLDQASNSVTNQFVQGSNLGPNQFGQVPNLGTNQIVQGSNSGPNQFGQGPNTVSNQFGQGPNTGPNQYGQGPNIAPNQFGQGPNKAPNQFGQGSNTGLNQFSQGQNTGPNQFGQGVNTGPNQFIQGPNTGSNQFGQGPNTVPNQFSQGPNTGPNQYGQGPKTGLNQFGQGSNTGPNQFGQSLNTGPNQFGQGPNTGLNQFGQGPNSGLNQFGKGSNSGPSQFGQRPTSGPNQFGQGPKPGSNQFGQGSNTVPNKFAQGPNMGLNKDWQGIPGQTNWQGPNPYNQGQSQYNQGPRGNPMNGRIGDNRPQLLDNMNMNQQKFGIYDNFRGRGGRGNFGGGPMRARGRGRF